jgi:sulfate transport system ATP-binding protein
VGRTPGDRFAAELTRRDAGELLLREGETVHAHAAHRTSIIEQHPALAI